ncbi:MAG: outer membrane beta-barrel protein [Deltaproteobacteria bacterium]|nr:outer membrane beta-barrel protein [Deltaproteobacteria bacterium]MCL5792641.1 outer membrane beta-barrel protein [Deltaproteobacteria bacterium]
MIKTWVVMFFLLACVFTSSNLYAREYSMRQSDYRETYTENKNTYFNAGIGDMIVPFSSFQSGFSFGIGAGERVYRHSSSSLSIGLGIDYYPIDKSGSASSIQTGTISYHLKGYALPILIQLTYDYTINDLIDIYGGIGLGIVSSSVNTSISKFSSVSEQGSSFGFSVYPGIRINKLGPGAIFAEFNFISSSVNYLTTGSANIGGTLFLIGYNIFF